jgi:uncharacterized membrane protein required for colicin V production
MALALTIIITLVLILLGLVGYVRDMRRGLLALTGTLLGAILVNFWGTQWGPSLASRVVGGDPQRLTFVVNCVIFLWSALIIGYGGGVLLSRAKDRPIFSHRLAGALLGALNGVLIVGYLLRFATEKQPGFAAIIQSAPLARLFHDGLPLLFLSLAALVTLLVVGRGLVLAFGGRPAPVSKPAAPAAPATSTAPQPAKLTERDILNKVNDAARRQ